MRTFILGIFIVSCLAMQAQEKYVITSDSVQLYVKVEGTGPACLYIHGGPGSGSNWLDELMGDSLEQHFQMIYLDQRGVGRSSSPAHGNYSPERMVSDFEEVRNSLGITQWLTLGHSFGGILQMEYVKKNPEVISGMILINCTLDMNDSFGNSWLPKAAELLENNVPAICSDTSVSVYQRMLAVMPVLGEKGDMWKIFFKSEEDSWKMNQTYSRFENWNSDQSEQILELDDYWQDYRSFSEQVSQPVLFYYGKTDWAIGPEHYRDIKFPNMVLWGGNTGHMPFIEDQNDLMKAINAYLESHSFQNERYYQNRNETEPGI